MRQEGQTEVAQQTYDLAELEQKYFIAELRMNKTIVK